MEKIMYQGQAFYTAGSGQQILFNGLNVLCRDPKMGYMYPDFKGALPWFKESGFNLIRLGIFWDGTEPEPGTYDMDYLAGIKDIVKAAEQEGIYVILDMHQDLFSVKFIDGAPLWATLDEGKNHPDNCNVWYLAYFQSDAVIQAADSFWENRPAPDGAGLLDHYVSMWEMLAGYFKDCGNIIALEPMNEPFMGSLARNAFGQAMAMVTEKYPEFNIGDMAHVTPQQQEMFLKILEDRFKIFDQQVLMGFYRRIGEAVHKHWDVNIATGGNIFSSTAISTGLERLEPSGKGQIYVPHGYDSVVDTDQYDAYNTANVDGLFADKKRSQERLDLPVIVGEWGAFPSGDFTNKLIRHMIGILEKYLWGSAYCEYHPGMENDGNFSSLRRAYPVFTSGRLESYHYDESTPALTVEYKAEPGETLCYCPFPVHQLEAALPMSYSVEKIGEGAYFCKIATESSGLQKVKIC